ncbi:transcription factor HES-1-B-like [Thalassophryne amazonica]|uniref:transcription factor HES-1-B-like n=1 Tax=Thalassophryne amazonica TaxID=390379 RepID=UPI001470E82F|nr:transcription factor HES-1-B-like [Thalassophryne amazonica]
MLAGASDRTSAGPDGRKSSKPIMEKRRRARINESLSQLKSLILDALKKDSSRHSKLEKADILEMTVTHLRNLQRLQMSACLTAVVNTDPSVLGKYRAGFSECVGEVTRFLSTCEGVDAEVRTRLLSHLATCVTQISAVNLYTSTPGALMGAQVSAAATSHMACKSVSMMTASTEVGKLYSGFQVVPTQDGQLAFFVPSKALKPISAHNSHYMSCIAPAVTSDSVWRPW